MLVLSALRSGSGGTWYDALPGHWIDPAGQVVVRRLAAQAAVVERHSKNSRQQPRKISVSSGKGLLQQPAISGLSRMRRIYGHGHTHALTSFS
jgi:hypothetical protein